MPFSNFVYIDHDESDSLDGYKGVYVRLHTNESVLFNSGDPVADWENMLEFAAQECLNDPDRNWMFSSSVDHFVHDVKGYVWGEDAYGRDIIVEG